MYHELTAEAGKVSGRLFGGLNTSRLRASAILTVE
jgi:hypothetical protein